MNAIALDKCQQQTNDSRPFLKINFTFQPFLHLFYQTGVNAVVKSQFSSGSHRCPIKVITGVVHHIINEHALLTLDKHCTNCTHIHFALILNTTLIILSFKS